MGRALNGKMKRRRARRQAIFIILGLLVVTMMVSVVFAVTPPNPPGRDEALREKPPEEKNGAQASEEVAGVQVENIAPLSLGLGGDVCLGQGMADVVSKEGPGYPWADIAPVLKGYDVTAVNLEGPLCHGGEPHPDQTSFHAKGDASCAPSMAEAGVDAVCLANDHIMDYGSQGLEETLNILHGQGLKECGAGSSSKMAQQPLVMGAENGARMAMLSFSDVAPPSYTAGESSPGLAAADIDRVSELVEQAARETPYVVVFFHWGTAGSPEITDRQRELAHAAVLAGADLVVGCHPRLVQGLEIWRGVPIVYSLGSLVFSAQNGEEKNGIFAGCRFDGGQLKALEILPLQVNKGRPVPLSGERAERAILEMAASSPGIDLTIDPETGKAFLNL